MVIVILLLAYLSWEVLAGITRWMFETPAKPKSKQNKTKQEILSSNFKFKW